MPIRFGRARPGHVKKLPPSGIDAVETLWWTDLELRVETRGLGSCDLLLGRCYPSADDDSMCSGRPLALDLPFSGGQETAHWRTIDDRMKALSFLPDDH